jgi:hypothetical protein
MLRVVAFKVSIVGLVKVDQNRHDFTQTHLFCPPVLPRAAAELPLLPAWLKGLAE